MSAQPRIKGRLTYLWTFELIGALLFCLLVRLNWHTANLGVFALLGLGLVVLLLIQGSLFWYAKLRAVCRRPLLTQDSLRSLFRVLRIADLFLLGSFGLALLFTGFAGRTPNHDLLCGVAFWTIACLEYVNYYFRQLMYDTPSELRSLFRLGRLKPASLGRFISTGRL